MKKIITAIGNPMLNKRLRQLHNCNVISSDITNDEQVIEYLERVNNIDYLFLSNKVIKNYKVDEFIKIIRKFQENIVIFFFKYKECEINVKEDEKFKFYNKLEIDLKELDQLISAPRKKKESKSKVIAIAGASGVRQKHIFHIFCKKCGK